MPGPFDALSPLFAQGAPPAADGGGGSPFTMVFIFLPMIVLFYFMLIRPQQRQEKQRRRMIEALKKNQRVLTSAGIYGTVVSIDPDSDRMVLRVGDNTKIDFTRSSVVRVLEDGAEKGTETAK